MNTSILQEEYTKKSTFVKVKYKIHETLYHFCASLVPMGVSSCG